MSDQTSPLYKQLQEDYAKSANLCEYLQRLLSQAALHLPAEFRKPSTHLVAGVRLLAEAYMELQQTHSGCKVFRAQEAMRIADLEAGIINLHAEIKSAHEKIRQLKAQHSPCDCGICKP